MRVVVKKGISPTLVIKWADSQFPSVDSGTQTRCGPVTNHTIDSYKIKCSDSGPELQKCKLQTSWIAPYMPYKNPFLVFPVLGVLGKSEACLSSTFAARELFQVSLEFEVIRKIRRKHRHLLLFKV